MDESLAGSVESLHGLPLLWVERSVEALEEQGEISFYNVQRRPELV